MCCKQFALNIFSETTRPRALIFGMKHFLVDFYQGCSVGGPRVQNGPAARWRGGSTKVVQLVAPGSKMALQDGGGGGSTMIVQLVAPGSKMALQHGGGGGLGLENEICLKSSPELLGSGG